MPMPVRSLAELHFDELIRNKEFTPSPTAWEDEVLYFLLVDRFSDGNEKGYRGLDGIILNHTGNVFSYNPDRYLTSDSSGRQFLDARWDGNRYDVRGFNDSHGNAGLTFARTDPANPTAFPGPDDAIWPVEFQDPAVFTCKGHISNFDYDPEFRDGDFFDLKDVHHGAGTVDAYEPSAALVHQLQVYKYWIAFADLDGYRVDTV